MAVVSSAIPVFDAAEPRAARATSPWLLRSLLLFGSVAAIAVAASLGDPRALLQTDPQLATLLRGMAAIKGAIVLAAVAVLLWRFTHSVSNAAAFAYLAGTWVLAGASTLIWQLSYIPIAAVAFHVAALALLVTAWRDDGSALTLLRRRA